VADHPVKVPEELVKEWMAELYGTPTFIGEVTTGLADRAAQWGRDQREPELQERADQELEACIDVLGEQSAWDVLGECTGWKEFRDQSEDILRAARRPKPPSLAEQGMEELRLLKGDANSMGMGFVAPAICAALTRLAELEANQ
jgi:hypothetical protein